MGGQKNLLGFVFQISLSRVPCPQTLPPKIDPLSDGPQTFLPTKWQGSVAEGCPTICLAKLVFPYLRIVFASHSSLGFQRPGLSSCGVGSHGAPCTHPEHKYSIDPTCQVFDTECQYTGIQCRRVGTLGQSNNYVSGLCAEPHVTQPRKSLSPAVGTPAASLKRTQCEDTERPILQYIL